MDYLLVLSLVVMMCLRSIDAQSLSVKISPEDAQFPYRGNLTIMCQANLAITHCQFRLYNFRKSYPTIDFNNGDKSPEAMFKGSDRKLKYKAKYFGNGLSDGQCGIALTGVYWGRYLVGCRVRSATNGWREAQMTVRSGSAKPGFAITITPRKSVIALPGSDVTILCAAKVPLSTCYMDIHSEKTEIFFNHGPASDSTSHYKYYGAGLPAGECGISLMKVTDADNGPVWCWGEQPGSTGTARATILTVAKAPNEPELSLKSGSSYSVGDSLIAECVVRGSRPTASITWLVGGKELRKDDEDDFPVDEWVWPWEERMITQRLTLTVKREHNGQPIICRVDHPALREKKENKIIILLKSALPNLSDCGVQYRDDVTLLIAGGQDAEPGEFPWHAGIYKREGASYGLKCGGTLISAKLVLTAAHCMFNENTKKVFDKSLYQITLGKTESNWDVDKTDRKVQRIGLSEIALHSRYNGRRFNFQYDIAVLRLATPAQINNFVGLICVDWENSFEDKQLVPGNLGTVAGWGATLTKNQSEVLQKVDLPFVQESVCLNAIEQIFPYSAIFLTWDKFCAGFVKQDTSVCKGDSGSGFVFRNASTSRYYLRGIVSVGFASANGVNVCSAQLYTGFTGVSNYLQWVRPFMIK